MDRLAITLATTVPAFFMREKPTSSSRKPACMKNTRIPATSTQTVSMRLSASFSVGSMSGSSNPAGPASFARRTGFAPTACTGG